MISVHIITGQTATGKTQSAINIAKDVGGYIINADSRQLYKDADIITGKDKGTARFHFVELYTLSSGIDVTIGFYTIDSIDIWGYDLITLDQTFSAYDYLNVFERITQNTINMNKIPIVVGGTYLYIKGLLQGIDPSTGPHWELREKLAHYTVMELQSLLQSLAPEIYEKLNTSDRANPHRLMRKIEISQATQSDLNDSRSVIKPISYTGYAYKDREVLAQTIAARVQKRIKAGAVKEVAELLSRGYNESSPGLRTIGYKQLISYLKEECSLEKAIELWITAEVQYAKRQYTFMKKDMHISWKYLPE